MMLKTIRCNRICSIVDSQHLLCLDCLLLMAGAKDKRHALLNAKIMVHQPYGGFEGQATDIEIHAKEILATRARLNEIYAGHTGQALDVIEEAMERDRFMTAEEAKEFGLIDHVVEHRRPTDAAGDEGNDTDEGS